MHIDLWDHEHGDADKIRDQASAVAQDALAVAAGVATALLAGAGAGTAVAAGLISKITGLLAPFGDAIGSLVASIFDDDRIGSIDFPIDSNYLQRLTGTYSITATSSRSRRVVALLSSGPACKKERAIRCSTRIAHTTIQKRLRTIVRKEEVGFLTLGQVAAHTASFSRLLPARLVNHTSESVFLRT
ncbi:MAG TPA: hypothetical protein VFO40_26020 [Chthoniobacterales bacterium]|nr:hypothetical protein [Chthoniobacterales bacterium]